MPQSTKLKWFTLEYMIHGQSDQEHLLYRFPSFPRQLMLPTIKGTHYLSLQPIRESLPADVESMKSWGAAVTREEFTRIIKTFCERFPDRADLFRSLPPCSRVGHILLERVGPACPEIVPISFYGDYIIRQPLRDKIMSVPGISFFPALLRKAVPLKWDLGQPMPSEFLGEEPESFILDGVHSPALADQMGNFYELVLPESQWYDPKAAPRNSEMIRIAFKGDLPHKGDMYLRRGRVKLAFEASPEKPWTRLRSGTPGSFGFYVVAREDVVKLLGDSARWTLRFNEVEQF